MLLSGFGHPQKPSNKSPFSTSSQGGPERRSFSLSQPIVDDISQGHMVLNVYFMLDCICLGSLEFNYN
jgi:hypothetical protein